MLMVSSFRQHLRPARKQCFHDGTMDNGLQLYRFHGYRHVFWTFNSQSIANATFGRFEGWVCVCHRIARPKSRIFILGRDWTKEKYRYGTATGQASPCTIIDIIKRIVRVGKSQSRWARFNPHHSIKRFQQKGPCLEGVIPAANFHRGKRERKIAPPLM